MAKRRKKPAGLARFSATALAASAMTVAIAADIDWDSTYTPETHRTIDPVNGEGTMTGLDAKPRGYDATDGDTTVDKWYVTWDSSDECQVDFTPPGMMIIIR